MCKFDEEFINSLQPVYRRYARWVFILGGWRAFSIPWSREEVARQMKLGNLSLAFSPRWEDAKRGVPQRADIVMTESDKATLALIAVWARYDELDA